MMPGPTARVLVLGGGVAGIAAAFAARDRGYEVELWEGRPRLGGRAFSVHQPRFDRVLDNGPHVMLGCYGAMRRLLRRLGTENGFEQARTLRLAYRDPRGKVARLRLLPLPTPLAMPLGVLGLPLGIGGRLRATWGLVTSLFLPTADLSLAEWLRRRGQGGAPERYLWVPLCRAVMNAEPHEVEARLFLATLRQAFTGTAGRAAIWIPKAPWQELIGDAAAAALERAGVQVRTGVKVDRIEPIDGGSRVVAGDESCEVRGDDRVVSALPWAALERVRGCALPQPFAVPIEPMPIYSVYFECEDAVAPQRDGDLVALVDGDPFHYLCWTPGQRDGRFAVLAGGCTRLSGHSTAELERMARDQIARHVPSWNPETAATVRVVKESPATFLAAPGLRRPSPGPLPGGPPTLLVCGDWTDVGLPSTLEGAARSGEAVFPR